MNCLQKIAFILGACGSVALVSACAEEFAPGPRGSEPVGAVEAPVEQGSATGEMASLAQPGTALVTVDGPNSKVDHPTVHTIIDGILKPPASGLPPAATVSSTTTRPATVIIQPRRPDAISGPGE